MCGWMAGRCGTCEWHLMCAMKVSMCMHACMSLRCLRGCQTSCSTILHPLPPRQSLPLNLGLSCPPVSLKSPFISASHSPGVSGGPCHAQLFIQVLGSKLRSSRLYNKSLWPRSKPVAMFHILCLSDPTTE